MGAGVGDYQGRGTLMALSELSLKFKAPLRSGDVFRVDTSVEQVGMEGGRGAHVAEGGGQTPVKPLKRAPSPRPARDAHPAR
jgi:hypothetical protein